MKRLFGLALAAIVALGCSTPAIAGYDYDIVNPEVAANQLTLRTDTDGINCYIPVADTTHLRPFYVPCSQFAAVGAQAFTGATTFSSTVGVTGLLTATGGIAGGSSSNIAINTNKFTVAASSGNTLIAGTLNVTGATVLASTLAGGSTSDIAINTNKFTVAASSGNTLVAGTLAVTGATTATGNILANGGVDGIVGGNTPAAVSATALTVGTSIDTHSMTFGSVLIGNPLQKVVKGTCSVATVNAGTCIPLADTASRTITVTGFDIIAAGSAATCTGVILEDDNGSPVVIDTIAAAALTSGTHNFPGIANNVLGVGFGAGTGLTAGKGVQIIVNGSGCTTTTSFAYEIAYTVQ